MEMPQVNYEEVRTRGFTIVKGMLGPDLCQRLRDTTDAIVGPIGERSTSVELEGEGRHLIDPHNSEVFDIDHALATHRSVVGSSNYRHGIRHPIFGPDPACLAEAALAGNMVEMQKKLLRSGDGLRLMQQQLVRSDPDPKAAANGSAPNGWHMDTAFLPKHYGSVPQQNVHHVVTALNTSEHFGATFWLVPNSFAQSKARGESMPPEERDALRDSDFRTVLRPLFLSEIDTSEAIEVLLEEGDSCVFDQMTVHSASSNARQDYSRYVLFTTFLDISASYALLPYRGASQHPRKFPPEFRAALPEDMQYLLDWDVPEDEGRDKSGSWGMAENKLDTASSIAQLEARATATAAANEAAKL